MAENENATIPAAAAGHAGPVDQTASKRGERTARRCYGIALGGIGDSGLGVKEGVRETIRALTVGKLVSFQW